MDAFHMLLALGPLAGYLFVLGAINLLGRPAICSGVRDVVALGAALAGLAIVGPMELFVPIGALATFGAWTWLLLVTFYGSCVMFVALMMRPRLVVYNIAGERLHALLAEIAVRLDAEARWSGASLILPKLAVHLQIEPFNFMRNVSLVSVGPRQSQEGWNALHEQLHTALADEEAKPNPRGYSLLSFALAMTAIIAWKVIDNPQAVVQQFHEFLRV
jgi:hypothetical protein